MAARTAADSCGRSLPRARTRMSVSRAQAHAGRARAHYLHAVPLYAYFFSCRSTKITSRRLYLPALSRALFEARLRTLSPVWELADVTNQARLRMLSAYVCMLWPSCSAPHSIACASFSLCIVLSVYRSLSLMPSSFNTELFTLAVLRPMGLFVCLAVLRCSPSGSLFC